MLRKVQHSLLLGVLASVSLHGQVPPQPLSWTSAGSRIVSPAVVATCITRHGRTGNGELELVVLWRGSPGWFLKGGQDNGGGSSTWGGTSARGPRGSQGIVEHQAVHGGLELNLHFNRRTRTVQVQGREVVMQDANVILVDQVDAGEDLAVVGTRWIDPQVSGPPVRVEQALGRSSELVAFLRCDASLSNPLVQGMVQRICRELLR